MNESDLYLELAAIGSRLRFPANAENPSVTQYTALVREETWQQAWNPEIREIGQVHDVTGNVWSDAIERCLQENGAVFIPRFASPVYIDRPIVLTSGNRLIVHPETEIRLKVGSIGTCMVRSSHIILSKDRPLNLCEGADQDILIEGGIWCDQNNEGRGRGGEYDQAGSMPGSMATMILHNVERVAVRNMTFRDCSSFAVQIGNVLDFIIENILFDDTADGIHVEGPAKMGVIRHLQGKTNDDIVALNAWDWYNASLTFGPITDILVEDVQMPPAYTWSEIRLLPGTKVFTSGDSLDCDICRCIFRSIRGIHTFKMYDQPNIANPEKDFANPIGKMEDLFFSDIQVAGMKHSEYYDKSSDAVFDICTDIDGISIQDVWFDYIPGEADMAPYLVSVGPKSLIWRRIPSADSGSAWRPAVEGEAAQEEFVQVFNPQANPEVKGLVISGVWIPDKQNPGAYQPAPGDLLEVHHRG